MAHRFGRYETIAPIASGGMATVYLGRAVGAGGFERQVAIKVMHPHIAEDPEFEAMFLDEARLAARIHHPNVVPTLDIQKTDEAMFLVMDYVDGCSLRDILRPLRKAKGRLPIGNALRIMIDALAGLHAAHELCGKDGEPLGLVHRDVSPHNILVGADGISKITDFGVARANARLTSTRGGQLKGKIAYMPPEQGRGDDIDRRADIYAAGVVLWEALVGRRLFRAEHDGALVAMVLVGATRSPRDEVPYIPEAIDAACMKALAVSPDDRYPTAAAFADALEEAAHEAKVRLPTARQLAAFVHRYKVELKSEPPPAPGDVRATLVTGSEAAAAPMGESADAGATGAAAVTNELEDRATGADSVATGTSQLTGIGAVRSGLPPAPPKTVRAVGIGAVAVVLAVAATAWLMSGPGNHSPAASARDQPLLPAAATGAPSAADHPGAASSSSAASHTAATAHNTAANPSSRSTASAAPTASTARSSDSAAAASATASAAPKATATGRRRHGGRGPLGFEPTGL